MVCSKSLRRTYSRLFFIFFSIIIAGINSHAQLLDTRLSFDLNQGSLDKCILQLQQRTGFSFAYESSGLESLTAARHSFQKEKLSTILTYLFRGTGYIFEEKHNIIIIGPGNGIISRSNQSYHFNGVIEDKETGHKLEGVAVYDPNSKTRGTFTDHNGYFSLTATSDTLRLRLSYLSYKPVEVVLHAENAPLIRIKMHVVNEGLDSVVVGDPQDVTPVFLSKFSPSIRKLSFLPKFCGDVDLISLLRITPGVQDARAGSGTVIVRGGAPDQNLLLVDDVNIYGATHLFGLLSSVNANTVREVNIYKGEFPARFSGRISSVWDVTLKDGNTEKLHGIMSLGTMASDLMLEGPLGNSKTTFMIAGRRSYHDIYARFFTPGLTFYFQDLNLKLHRRLSEKDHLYLIGYVSQDRFQLESDVPEEEENIVTRHTMKLNTENYAAGLRWRHDFSGSLQSNVSLMYSAYNLSASSLYSSIVYFPGANGVVINQEEKIRTGLYDLGGKLQLKYSPNRRHNLEGGLYYTLHTFKPHSFQLSLYSSDPAFLTPALFEEVIKDTASREAGGYLEDRISISDRLQATAGFHINQYRYDKRNYSSFQPRLSLSYRVATDWFIKAAYVKMQQNLHRLTISQTNLPLDFWIPSTSSIRPQSSDQVSLGTAGKLVEGLLDIAVEAYYKSMDNVAEYLIFKGIDTTAQQPPTPSWNNDVTTGKGRAYGIEFSIRKSSGNFNGWINYALAWSNRTLPEVNQGRQFPYKYDRRHNLNLVALYKLGTSWELSAVFTFQSKPKPPVPIIKTSDLSNDAINIRAYAAQADLRAYHRLDLGINWNKEYKNGSMGTWNLSVFNVYNRENTFYYFSSDNQVSGNSLLPVSAALSYTLRF